MRIATWNINSIRTRVDQTVAWSVANEADVVINEDALAEQDIFQ